MEIIQYYENLLFKYLGYDMELIEMLQLLGSQSIYSEKEIAYLETVKMAFQEIQQHSELYHNQNLNIPWWEYPYLDIENRILNRLQFDILNQENKEFLFIALFQYKLYNRELFYLILGDGEMGIQFMGKMLVYLLILEDQYKNQMEDPYWIENIHAMLKIEINHEMVEQILSVTKMIRGNENRYISFIRKIYRKMLLIEQSQNLYENYINSHPEEAIKTSVDAVEEFIIRDFKKHIRYTDKSNVSSRINWQPLWIFGTKLSKDAINMEQELEDWAEDYFYHID